MLQLIKLLRAKHWIKNFFIFAPLIFSINFFKIMPVAKTLLTFISFSFAASFVYIINDIFDKKRDRLHPVKKDRPIASGSVSILTAVIIALVMVIIALLLAYVINVKTVIIVSIYLLLNLFYSIALKHEVIIDVMIIAIGFVLRVMAGAFAIDVAISSWLLLCTLFIALFIGFGKRRHELLLLEDGGDNHRPVLNHYNLQLLDYVVVASVTLTIISYSLYTIDAQTVEKFNTSNLVYTIPLVIYGLFKYLFILYKKEGGGDPADIVSKDKTIIASVIIWIISIIYILISGGWNV